MLKVLRTVLVLLILFAAGCTIKKYEKEEAKRIPFTQGSTLELKTGDGDVVIDTWHEDSIIIKASKQIHLVKMIGGNFPGTGRGEIDDLLNEIEIHVEQKEKKTVIQSVFPEIKSGGASIDFDLRVPDSLSIELNGDDGDIEISKTRGDIRGRTDDGDVELMDIVGDISLVSDDGDIEFTGIDGRIDIMTDDGGIDFNNITGNTDIETEDGDVMIEKIEGDLSIYTDDGDVSLVDCRGNLKVRTDDGWVECDIDEVLVPSEINITTDDGDIELAIPSYSDLSIFVDTDDIDDVESDFPFVVNREKMEGRVMIILRTGNGDVSIKKK